LSRWPVKIVYAPFVTVTFVAVNVKAQPLSHIFPTESSECWAKPGRICACLAACGKDGRFNVAVCVDATVTPLGRRTSKGVSESNLASARRKCAVHPESKIAVDCDGGDGVKFR
jgi:hypothetical protein